ncbi:N-acetylmuramoyl-L-alanine amidase [Pseudoxanthomonas indica]|uniref:N-acetylmuramoyl-L-alanine amidase n=1 Tax=Pseudoxanthomonas indica TaxID=428993 RepID=A0A1T5LR56_9GAMM|nr:N-acetylmuramoyl-L-alanine amidase [Pseudoxanthomonas indica]GGD38489.1 N-acetylmuramoyl-L-alanine amidase [Pseudoxanthomonas indica]SKC78420.1 N-acetylmuramoyl-L-alanine amidase [Pseudoxanthomonas indica]
MPEPALSLPLHVDPLPYQDRLEPRDPASIDLVVIHCTELPDLAMARQFGEEVRYPSGTGNSGHYYIDRDGSLHQYVDPAFIAHHVRGYNPRAIGIELVNSGRCPNWLARDAQQMDETYPDAQIQALIALLRWLCERYPSLRHIEGHEDLDTTTEPASDDPSVQVQRKLDPGPHFPWPQVLAATDLQRGRLPSR